MAPRDVILGHLRAILLLPVMVTIVVPALLLAATGGMSGAWPLEAPLLQVACLAGIALIVTGLVMLVVCATLFATVGKGTLAPWDPARRLVVQGIYRHVRNLMICGVFAILLGEALAVRSAALLGWLVLFFLGNLMSIRRVEERDLEHRFGREYVLYQTHVPRRLPRPRPWRASAELDAEVPRDRP